MGDDVVDIQSAFNKALGDLIGGVVRRADEERAKSEPYKELWVAADGGVGSLLRSACGRIDGVMLDVVSVLRDRFGVKESDELCELIAGVSVIKRAVCENIRDVDGFSCNVDKFWFLFVDCVLCEIKRVNPGFSV